MNKDGCRRRVCRFRNCKDGPTSTRAPRQPTRRPTSRGEFVPTASVRSAVRLRMCLAELDGDKARGDCAGGSQLPEHAWYSTYDILDVNSVQPLIFFRGTASPLYLHKAVRRV